MKYYEVDFRIDAPNCVIDDVRDVLSVLAGEVGFETFEETDFGVKGYVQQSLFDQAALDAQMAYLPFENAVISYDVREAEDRDWNEQWEKEGFQPIIISDQCMIHDGRHFNSMSPSDYRYSIEIDTRLAFGTGTHETTRMMVASILECNLSSARVLDCGCGTGILGLVALKAGACEAVGYDIDEWSVDNARHNAVINRLDSKYHSLHGNASVLNEVEGTFDLICANINRNILLEDMASFRGKLKKNGKLLMSGFYQQDIAVLTSKACSLGLEPIGNKTEGEWACLSLILA